MIRTFPQAMGASRVSDVSLTYLPRKEGERQMRDTWSPDESGLGGMPLLGKEWSLRVGHGCNW